MIQKRVLLNLRNIICIQPKLCVLSGRRYTNECDRMWQKQTLTRDATISQMFLKACMYTFLLRPFIYLWVYHNCLRKHNHSNDQYKDVDDNFNWREHLTKTFCKIYILIYLWMTNISYLLVYFRIDYEYDKILS